MHFVESTLGPSLNRKFIEKLTSIFQDECDFSTRDVRVPWTLIEKHFGSFCEVLLWLKETLEQRHAAVLEDPNSA